jgi:glutaredoxin 3
MKRIQLYTTEWCGFCVRAKTMLESKGVEFEEIRLDDDPAFRAKLFDLTGHWTVPQVIVAGRPIGGYAELRALEREGRLDGLLAAG